MAEKRGCGRETADVRSVRQAGSWPVTHYLPSQNIQNNVLDPPCEGTYIIQALFARARSSVG